MKNCPNVSSPRAGLQPGLGDRLATPLTLAVAAVFDPLQHRFNLVEKAFLPSHKIQR